MKNQLLVESDGRIENDVSHNDGGFFDSGEPLTRKSERRIYQKINQNNFAFIGLPIVQNAEFTTEYKQHFAQFEKSLLHELINIVSMQNAVYY